MNQPMTTHTSYEENCRRDIAALKQRLFGKPKSTNIIQALRLQKLRDELEIKRLKEERKREAAERAERIRLYREEVDRKKREALEQIEAMENEAKAVAAALQAVHEVEQAAAEAARPTMEMIAQLILDGYPGISLEDVRQEGRDLHMFRIRREILSAIHRILPDKSPYLMGKFVNRDRTTVLSALGLLKGQSRSKEDGDERLD